MGIHPPASSSIPEIRDELLAQADVDTDSSVTHPSRFIARKSEH